MEYYIATVKTDEGFIIGRTFGVCQGSHEFPVNCYELHFINFNGRHVFTIFKSKESALQDAKGLIFYNWNKDRVFIKPISEMDLR